MWELFLKTENYIREILTECIKICPICKRETANRSVSFGSMMWQRSGEFEKGIFENISFSDSSAIKKELKNSLKVDINKNELLSELLDEFDKLCQMRHAIVHSSRVLAGKNAIQLNIPPSIDKLSIRVGYAQLQECASICTACVMTFNLKLFEVMGHRWAIDWRRLTDFWDEEKEDEYFSKVTMPPAAAQMMMKAVGFLLLVHICSNLLYPYSGDTSTLQSTL